MIPCHSASCAELRTSESVDWEEALGPPDGTIVRYAEPKPGHSYVIGADFAYGLKDGDWDAAVVLDLTGSENGSAVEVACAHGHWGVERFDRVIYALHRHFNRALIVGERQVGLAVLRRLWDDYGVREIYSPSNERTRVRRPIDSLGYPKRDDYLLHMLRRAIRDEEVEVRSRIIIEEMARLTWRRPVRAEGRVSDIELKAKLRGGGSPDLVVALSLAALGKREYWMGEWDVRKRMEEERTYDMGTLGKILGHNDTFPSEAYGGSWIRKRKRR